MQELPVRKIPGVGRVTEQTLQGLEIIKCSDVVEKAAEIYVAFSERSFGFLVRSALGIARNHHEEEEDDGIQKSISVSRSFRAISSKDDFIEKIRDIAEELEKRVAKRKIGGRALTLELKNTKF